MEGEMKHQAIPRRQRGSIAMFAALGLGVTVIMLSILDMGFLYSAKRNYQNAADLAALAGASRMYESCGVAESTAAAHARHQLGPARDGDLIEAACGRWQRNATPPFVTTPGSAPMNAVRVQVSGEPRRFFVPGNRRVTATAVAMADNPMAALTLRSSLASVNSNQSALLNAVVGELLGGSLNLGVGAWNGLLQTDLNLLSYLDALAISLGVEAGNYDSLLGQSLTVGELLGVAADVLNSGGGTGSVAAAIAGLDAIIAIPGASPLVALGDLLNIATGTDAAGLDTRLNVFELIQGSVRLADGDNIVALNLPIQTGLANASLQLRLGDAGARVAVGNPAINDIRVDTANARALLKVELGAVTGLLNAINALTGTLLGPVVQFLDTVTNALVRNLDLFATVQAVYDLLATLLGCGGFLQPTCPERNVLYSSALSGELSVAIDLGGGNARVDDYSCAGEQKSLDVRASTQLGTISIGIIDESDFLDLNAPVPATGEFPLVEIGYRRFRPSNCLLLGICWGAEWRRPNGTWSGNQSEAQRYVVSRIGIRAHQNPIAATQQVLYYDNDPEADLPDMGEAPAYQSLTAQNVVGSLNNTLGNLEINFYADPNFGGGLLSGTFALINGLLGGIQNELLASLSPLLDPVVEGLLLTLGAQLAQSEVGANLSCEAGGGILVQ